MERNLWSDDKSHSAHIHAAMEIARLYRRLAVVGWLCLIVTVLALLRQDGVL